MTVPTIGHQFVGRRQDGIKPQACTPCVECGYPRNQHIEKCSAVLNLDGKHYECDLVPPHDGWGHRNVESGAVWT